MVTKKDIKNYAKEHKCSIREAQRQLGADATGNVSVMQSSVKSVRDDSQDLNTSSRGAEVTGFNVSFPRTKGDNIAFCKMLNEFRDEYFDGNSPYDVTPAMLKSLSVEQGVHRNMFWFNDELIAIIEVGSGFADGCPSLGISTIYIKPSWRGKGISNTIYDYVENQLMNGLDDTVFYLQIEEPQLAKSRDSFIKLGFTHAREIPGFDNGAEYLHKTFAVCKGNAQWKNAVHIDSIITKEAA